MTTVRKDTVAVGENELIVEVVEDNPTSYRVTLLLMSKGTQGEIALGRVNLGQIFRKQNKVQALALASSILVFARGGDLDDEGMSGEEQLKTLIQAARKRDPNAARPQPVQTASGHQLPVPVKERGPSGITGAGIELDHLTRRDFAMTLRKLADQIETADPTVTIYEFEVEPFRGGGQAIMMRVTKAGK